jgi:hypothetical protein
MCWEAECDRSWWAVWAGPPPSEPRRIVSWLVNARAFLFLPNGYPLTMPHEESMRRQRINEWWGYRPFFQWDDLDPLTFVIEFFYWRFVYDVNGRRCLRRELGVSPPSYRLIWSRG